MCAGKLTSLEFLHLQEVIDLMGKKDNEMHTLRKSVSLDSQGYPACFGTPPAGENEHPLPKGARQMKIPSKKKGLGRLGSVRIPCQKEAPWQRHCPSHLS